MEEKNYIRDYFKKEEHNFNNAFNIDLDNSVIKGLKAKMKSLQLELAQKEQELSNEIEKSYANEKNFDMITDRIILQYCNRNLGNMYYDSDLGVEITDYNEEEDYLYTLDTKRGKIKVVKGYDFNDLCIIVYEYKYNISNDNKRISMILETIYSISFMEEKGKKYNIKTKTEEDYSFSRYSNIQNIKGKYFINKVYGVDYEGGHNLWKLREYNLENKSFEIIMKQAPNEIKDKLLKEKFTECLPIHKLLNITMETYNLAVKKGTIKYLYESLGTINNEQDNYVKRTEKEWLDLIDEMIGYEEDLSFYKITYSTYYGWGYRGYGENLLGVLLYHYNKEEILRENYSFKKYANYVVNETINQGYTSVTNFIGELRDYLSMCKQDNIKPTLYSSYLKQTHDITSRNHQIKVEEEQEEIFKSRYADFKEFKSSEEYYVVAPTCTSDLTKEGDNLNHCVASYIKRVVNGTCLIYFLRKNKEESLITFEVRNNTIMQVKGMHNRKPNEHEVKALKEFAEKRKMEVNFD